MSKIINRINYMQDFSCLKEKCPDHCCYNWSVAIDKNTIELYKNKAPKLLSAVTQLEDSTYEMNFSNNNEISSCSCLRDGLCGIQIDYGEEFLPDVCDYYPRSSKALNGNIYESSSISCPASCHLALFSDNNGFNFFKVEVGRIKSSLIDFLQENENRKSISTEQALALFKAFINIIEDNSISSDLAMLKILSISRLLSKTKPDDWFATISSIILMAENETYSECNQDIDIAYIANKLLLTLYMITKNQTRSERFIKVISKMHSSLLGGSSSIIADKESMTSIYANISNNWHERGEFNSVMKNFIKAKLSEVFFPICCFFDNIEEEILLIVMEYLMTRLALMCHFEGKISQDEIVRIVQTLQRVLYGTRKTKLLEKYKEMKLDDFALLKSAIVSY